jgi:hypothetical protein
VTTREIWFRTKCKSPNSIPVNWFVNSVPIFSPIPVLSMQICIVPCKEGMKVDAMQWLFVQNPFLVTIILHSEMQIHPNWNIHRITYHTSGNCHCSFNCITCCTRISLSPQIAAFAEIICNMTRRIVILRRKHQIYIYILVLLAEKSR